MHSVFAWLTYHALPRGIEPLGSKLFLAVLPSLLDLLTHGEVDPHLALLRTLLDFDVLGPRTLVDVPGRAPDLRTRPVHLVRVHDHGLCLSFVATTHLGKLVDGCLERVHDRVDDSRSGHFIDRVLKHESRF